MFDMMYAPDNILKRMEELHHQYFIILANDMPAGCLSIEKTGKNTYNLQKIYSLPEMHGTEIGRFIIKQSINCLKEVHTKPLATELYVNRYSPATGLYRYMELREVGTRDHHIGNGYPMDDYIIGMEMENK